MGFVIVVCHREIAKDETGTRTEIETSSSMKIGTDLPTQEVDSTKTLHPRGTLREYISYEI